MMTGSSSPVNSSPLLPQAEITTPSPAKQFNHSRTSSASKPRSAPITRSSSLRSKTKGINFNLAVSPISSHPSPSNANGHKRSSSILSNTQVPSQQSLPQLPENSPLITVPNSPIPSATEELKFDVPLPLSEHLQTLEIDDQLRLLALKEMSVVEIRDNINNLNNKLNRNEKELHRLREVIQKSLYRELSGQNLTANGRGVRQNSNPRDEAIASTKIGPRRRTLSSTSPNAVVNTSTNDNIPLDPISKQDSESKHKSALWSNLSKPLNLIQQFDNILTQEFEKSLIPSPNSQQYFNNKNQNHDYTHSNTSAHPHPQAQPFHSRKLSLSSTSTDGRKRHSEDSLSSTSASASSIPSPLKSKSDNRSKSNIDLDQYFPPASDPILAETIKSKSRNRTSEDMLQSVSSSIWSFVNDVKSNVLSSLGEDEESSNQTSNELTGPNIRTEPMYNLETGSTISLDETSPDTKSTIKAPYDNSDYANNNDNNNNDDDDEEVDLTMYTLLRRSELLKRR
ncbi:hypothetical protein HYPBUDRAFT_154304 [Hyphopichia burtonii NRRL Y-1933]|uniref:Topoisomerase I damage affected protein 11 n=1 Tax=Hyphopichia burtonii NRRL Y-1933 TaxID=984485 RepID=A0A1E4RC51_9ASCO|nr:hypothetical protein HYPBUDRAFT_154304 [Hyphopichia burtonii NRRL Y-1933]ODV64705.1 hypothetical protein HYPBUDRAFT_154304 [Hyphopichia burtonii NRRL Y-1933]